MCGTCEVLRELLLQLGGSVEGLPALLFRQAFVHLPARTVPVLVIEVLEKLHSSQWKHSHDVLHSFGFDEDGNGMKLSQLESLNGIPRHIQDTMFTLNIRAKINIGTERIYSKKGLCCAVKIMFS